MIGLMVRMGMIVLISTFGVSCVVATPKRPIDSSPSTEIQDIRVLERDGKMRIEIAGEEPMIYTTFHLTDPDRLVVDMAGIGLGQFKEEIQIENGPVRAIRPAQGGGDHVARLEFLLDDSVEADVKTEGLNLVVEAEASEHMKSRFTSLEGEGQEMPEEMVDLPTADAPELPEVPVEAALPATALAVPPAMDVPSRALSLPSMDQTLEKPSEKPAAATASEGLEPPPLVPLSASADKDEQMVVEMVDDAKPANTEAEDVLVGAEAQKVNPTQAKTDVSEEVPLAEQLKPLPKATRIKSIQWVREDDLKLVVTSDGALSPSIFFVDSERLVIDLPDVRAENPQTKIPSEELYIKQIRVGQHENKLRLVIDLNAPIDYDWQLEKNQLKVSLKAHTEEKGAAANPAGGATTPIQSAQAPEASSSDPNLGMLPDLPPSLPIELAENEQPAPEGLTQEEVVDEPDEVPAKHRTLLKRRRKNMSVALDSLPKSKPKIEEVEPASDALAKVYTGKKISLDFQDADTTNIIRLIAEVSGLNFVVADDVGGKVTLKLNDVPWDQALDIILEMHNLGKVREGNIIRVATLSNLAKQRDEEARAKEGKIKAEDLMTRVIYVNYAKADDMNVLLSKLLSSRGEIMVDKRTNALIVKDIKDNLREVERLASKMDTKTPQVLIEARIAEVQPVFLRSLGIKWGAGYNATTGGNLIGIGNSTLDSPINAGIPDFAVNLPASTSLGGIGFTFGRFTQNPFTLDLRLSAGETQALTRVVSTPKVMVLDNHEALIEQGESVPFSTVSQQGTQVQFIDAHLTLRVTPHISPDGGILLDVHLSKNEPGPVSPGAPGPPIFKKEVTTNVLLMDGETMVIGGIYETTKTDSESGIPWLKELPVIGWLFKNKETREDTSELLVFLTPKVMD